MLWSLSFTLSTILVISEFSKTSGAALRTSSDLATVVKRSTDEKSAIEYYSELLTQLVHIFPEVDSDEVLTNYQKRMYGRYGRTAKRVSKLYPNIAAELRAELDRRKLIDMQKKENIDYKPPDSSANSLQQMERRIANLESKLLLENKKTERADPGTTKKKTAAADDELERELLKMLEGERVRPETQADDREQPAERHSGTHSLTNQIESAQDQLAEIIGKLSQMEGSSENDDMLNELSKKLSANHKSESEGTTSTPSATTTSSSEVTVAAQSSKSDKLTQLASIVKNLIEVNQLAYLQLQDKISASR